MAPDGSWTRAAFTDFCNGPTMLRRMSRPSQLENCITRFGMFRMLDRITRIVNSGRLLASWTKLRLDARDYPGPFLHAESGTTQSAVERSPHILLFAWDFPPAINGGVYRPHSLAKHAAKAGWQVTVLSGPLEEQEGAAGVDLLKSLPPAVKIFRAPRAQAPSYRLIPKSGDGCFPEIITASHAAVEACRQTEPTVILASGPPFHTFFSAYFAARRFRVPLVLEYRDEWCVHTPHFVDATAFDKKWEERLLRFASNVIFVTDATRDLYLASIGSLDSKKCFVVPNGWDPDDFFDEAAASASKSIVACDRFVISFVGTIGLHTDPSSFLARFQEVMARRPALRECLLVRFAGPKTAEKGRYLLANFRDQFPNSIELVGGVAKSAAIAEMRHADALLLLLDPFYDTSIPGKLYEYLAAGTPILAFGETGIAADLVRRLGAGIVVPTDDSFPLEAAFYRLLKQPREQWDTPDRKAWVVNHTRGELATKIMNVLGSAATCIPG